ncbi:hypothetical protein LWC34_17505 [Kibdelosporangium philippinense]|uniref:Uncharacterized protein n=1 Tax=Kibdelosporangium philippinense TaxID=211113 RepID=A0ABS8ZAR3_9PSEU|nr:hypothetical protein [Kibdelosporangium philippinense]MCE7004607.1 hypothetical protein [Kibdelosporangium philippinense]
MTEADLYSDMKARRSGYGIVLPLFQLRYNGSAHDWGFAIYRATQRPPHG